MTKLGFLCVILDENVYHYNYPKIVYKSQNVENTILITSDEVLHYIPQITYINVLIHFSMPNSSKDISSRFGLMLDNLKAQATSMSTYFILNYKNRFQAIFLSQSIKRTSKPIPKDLILLTSYNTSSLCDNYLAFGFCPFRSTFCCNRHAFKVSEGPHQELMTDGQIKFIFSYIVTANEYYIRILEYRNGDNESGVWKKFGQSIDEMNRDLETLRNADLNQVKSPLIGELYAVVVRGSVQRVRITEIVGEEKLEHYQKFTEDEVNLRLKVFHIDYGHTSQCTSNSLIELSPQLKAYSPFAFKAYLIGIKPADNEIQWHHYATQTCFEKVLLPSDIYATAWIRLQVKCMFWLEDLRVTQKLKNIGINISTIELASYLIENRLALKNDFSVVGLNDNKSELILKWTMKVQRKYIQKAFLTLNSYSKCYLSNFINLNQFYLQKSNFYDCLKEFEDDIFKIDHRPLKHFLIGLICLCYFEPEKSYNRIEIQKINDDTVSAFFVDYGETYSVPKQNCYEIDKKFITRLPFQAIKCRLAGVEGNVEPVVIFDYTQNEKHQFLDILVEPLEKVDEEYKVRLFVLKEENKSTEKYSSFSKWLVDQNYASYSDVDEVNTLKELIMYKETKNDEDEINEKEQEYRQNMFDKINAELENMIRTLTVEADSEQIVKQERQIPGANAKLLKALRKMKRCEENASNNYNKDDKDDEDDEDDEGEKQNENFEWPWLKQNDEQDDQLEIGDFDSEGTYESDLDNFDELDATDLFSS